MSFIEFETWTIKAGNEADQIQFPLKLSSARELDAAARGALDTARSAEVAAADTDSGIVQKVRD